MIYWRSGEWRQDPVGVAIDDRGFLLGDAVFETMLARGGRLAFLNQHIARLRGALDFLKIRVPIELNEISRLVGELLSRNSITQGDASVRLTVTRGRAPRGLAPLAESETKPGVFLTAASAGPRLTLPMRVIISDHARPAGVASVRFKTPSYLENLLARREAVEAGADDAIMKNPAGRIACASAANVFLIRGGAVLTPPVSDGALPGVVRGLILEAARDLEIEAREESLAPCDLDAGEIFLTNSILGLAPAALAGSQPAMRSEIFTALGACYDRLLNEDLAARAGEA
ncbi:MAG: aminotransferase class IV [Pseudomonadota bacterium]